MDTFDYFYRKLAQATVAVLFSTLGLFVVSLACAVLGLAHAVSTFSGVTFALAYVFGALLLVFLVSSLVRALIYFLYHRGEATS